MWVLVCPHMLVWQWYDGEDGGLWFFPTKLGDWDVNSVTRWEPEILDLQEKVTGRPVPGS